MNWVDLGCGMSMVMNVMKVSLTRARTSAGSSRASVV